MKTHYFVFFILYLPVLLFSQGRIIIPELREDLTSGTVYLRHVNGEVQLKDGVGDIRLEQRFFNSAARQLEGEYLFALPNDAQIYDFNLYINGKKTKGELLDAEKAASIYRSIVRQIQDPALLEFAGYGLFKAHIFPIEPKKDRTIELSYAQTLETEGGMTRFTMPIRQSGQGSIASYHLTIELESRKPVSNIYSPSHHIEVKRNGENRATITLEASNLEGTKDFILYYDKSSQEIDANVLTFRPRTDRDGFFMLMAMPGQDIRQKVVAKDVIFVIDVSGSMGGEKISQAKDALQFCINTLREEDRFEIISFSSGIRAFGDRLSTADADTKENARYFVANLSASGGTNIDAALGKALELKSSSDGRPTSIVFLTDGLPTEGEQNIGKIIQNIASADKSFFRIFSFGVGFDVNTFLLDRLSLDSGGSTNYVKPGENIEREVSTLFSKIANPVLTQPEIDFGELAVYDVFPTQLPDLFKGERIILFGRYQRAGASEIILKGRQDGKDKRYRYKINLSDRQTDNAFIANLWANRKVADLMMRIRFDGENPELVESIRSLALEYGIVTPYTSYLVTEQETELAGLNQRGAAGGRGGIRLIELEKARSERASVDEEAVGSGTFYKSLTAMAPAPEQSTGRDAVMSSKVMKEVATQEKSTDMLLTVKRIADRTFQLKNGVWTENSILDDEKADREITFLSDAYFELVAKDPELKRILALGEEVLFRWQGKIYRIEK